MVNRNELARFLAETLNVALIHDYCPNGLQVEGKNDIGLIISGVTASLALIEAAIEAKADALLVHHGFFWRDESPCIVSTKYKRIKQLLAHDINLFAYHLPLDLHPVFGNNVQLAKQLDLAINGQFGENDLGFLGTSMNPALKTVEDFALFVETRLHRKPLLIGNPQQALGQIGWCTGAAQNLLPAAAEKGVTLFLSGEISEKTTHEARENQVAYLACGHHATERYGVQAIGELLAQQFNIKHRFIEIDNPA